MITVKLPTHNEVCQLPVGDCFMHNGILYQKTDMMPPGNPNKSICITVGTGISQTFSSRESVLPVDVEVIVQ